MGNFLGILQSFYVFIGTFIILRGTIMYFVSTGDLRFLPDLSTFYGRKVGIFTAVNRPIYGILFTGSQYKKDVNFGA